MEQIEQLAAKNQQKAHDIIRDTNLTALWEAAGAEIHLVGSLKTGLLVTHRDIDFHLYSPSIDIATDFKVMATLAAHPRIKQLQYINLLNTEEECLEWHAFYEDDENALWQIDLIHIVKGSRYDGYFERVAERITTVLTNQTRQAILRLKYETPATEQIPGILYYQAVLRDGVRTYDAFTRWRKEHPTDGVIEWMP